MIRHTRTVTDPRRIRDQQRYDDLARQVRDELGARIALLSIFRDERHIFIGAAGLSGELERRREISLIESFCAYVLDHGVQLIVDDVRTETRVAAHPLIAELGIHSYAGWQITDEGRTIGVLSVMDDKPREWTSRELIRLMEYAHDSLPLVRTAIAAG